MFPVFLDLMTHKNFCQRKKNDSEVNSFFDEHRKKLLAEQSEKYKAKQAELIEKTAKLLESEKNYISDMIKEHFQHKSVPSH